MKRFLLAAAMLLMLICPAAAGAADVSSDKMILEWNSSKVWIDGGNLCVTGTFVNKRSDITVTKLNDFVIKIRFTKDDGSEEQFTGRPVRLPMCKIPAGSSKKLTLNFGKYTGSWKSWVTSQSYTFSYINGAKW